MDTIDVQGEGDALMDRWAMDRDQYKSRHSNRDEDASRDNNMADIALVDKNGFQIVQPSKKKRKHEMKMKMHAAIAMTESEVREQHFKRVVPLKCISKEFLAWSE